MTRTAVQSSPPANRAQCSNGFSIREARGLVRDLFEPNPRIYWTDMLVSATLAGSCFVAMPRLSWWPVQVLVFIVGGLATYRAAMFTHELAHLRKDQFRRFACVWNLLIGIPLLIPSFTYQSHLAHHTRKHYGTHHDGEYLPLGAGPLSAFAWYFLQVPLIPLLSVARFLLFTPIAWVHPGFRRWVQQRASSMVMDPTYVRPLPSAADLQLWRFQEAGVFLCLLATASMVAAGFTHPTLLPRAYATALFVLTLNHVRSMATHRFVNRDEQEMTFLEQLLDSYNYPGRPLFNELWAPLGMRFHALHHLFPSLPYHNLAEAHRRLIQHLPADSPYRQTTSPGIWTTLRELWRQAKQPRQGSSNQSPLDEALAA